MSVNANARRVFTGGVDSVGGRVGRTEFVVVHFELGLSAGKIALIKISDTQRKEGGTSR